MAQPTQGPHVQRAREALQWLCDQGWTKVQVGAAIGRSRSALGRLGVGGGTQPKTAELLEELMLLVVVCRLSPGELPAGIVGRPAAPGLD